MVQIYYSRNSEYMNMYYNCFEIFSHIFKIDKKFYTNTIIIQIDNNIIFII